MPRLVQLFHFSKVVCSATQYRVSNSLHRCVCSGGSLAAVSSTLQLCQWVRCNGGGGWRSDTEIDCMKRCCNSIPSIVSIVIVVCRFPQKQKAYKWTWWLALLLWMLWKRGFNGYWGCMCWAIFGQDPSLMNSSTFWHSFFFQSSWSQYFLVCLDMVALFCGIQVYRTSSWPRASEWGQELCEQERERERVGFVLSFYIVPFWRLLTCVWFTRLPRPSVHVKNPECGYLPLSYFLLTLSYLMWSRTRQLSHCHFKSIVCQPTVKCESLEIHW